MPERNAELEQLRMLVERLPDALLSVDSELRLGAANTAAHRVFHPEPLRSGEKLPPFELDPGFSEFAASLFGKNIGPVRREVSPDEDHRFVLTGIPPGRGSAALIMIQDVSSQQRRIRAQQEFITNAAHELLTPLTGIVGAAHALSAGAKAEPELRDRFIGHIARECDRLARIARGLLVLARAQSGQEPPRPEIVQLRPLLEDASEGAGSTGDVEISCSDRLTAFVDRDLAEQAFTNLITNARRHSRPGLVLVRAFANSDGNVSVEIADEGPGFEGPGARVVRRFASGSGRDGGGFGLGLSIATQAVQLSGGRLEIHPGADRGTVVEVELPRGEPVAA